ncbi:MAG: hypothetical protein II027_03950, partial [Bacteroidales bacterium]|nr:hypothetical protein [Bacteroidales bacterium]
MRIINPYIHIVWIANPDNIALTQNLTHIKSSPNSVIIYKSTTKKLRNNHPYSPYKKNTNIEFPIEKSCIFAPQFADVA